jgi:hypothetical protein
MAPDPDAVTPYRAPATERQQTLCTLFAEVLGMPRCGIDDDFFAAGGQSVEAIVLAARISSALGLRVSIADLFKAPTVAELDRRLEGRSGPGRDGTAFGLTGRGRERQASDDGTFARS